MRIISLALPLLLSACLGLQGNGVPATDTLVVDERIVELDARNVVDVIVRTGEVAEATLTCDSNLIDLVEVTQDGDRLVIRNEPGTILHPRTDCRLALQVPTLETIRVSGSGDVVALDALPDLVEARSSASGHIELPSAGARDLALTTSGSGDIVIDEVTASDTLVLDNGASGTQTLGGIALDTVDLRIAGSGDLRLAGTARVLSADLVASGGLDAADLVVETAEIRIAGSGTAEVTVTDTVDARLSASGDLVVHGGAEIDAQVSGSGSVRRAR